VMTISRVSPKVGTLSGVGKWSGENFKVKFSYYSVFEL